MNYTYIFIMILILIIIYGLLFRIKNTKIINTIESFETNLTGINEIFPSAEYTMLDGKWTSINSQLYGDSITNTIRFTLNKDIKKGNIGKMNYDGKDFKIMKDYTNNIVTNTIQNNKYQFNFNPNYELYRLPFDARSEFKNVPIIEMINSNAGERALIFKFVNGKLSEKVRSLISNNKATFKSNTPKIDGLLYSSPSVINIEKYKFSPKALESVYMSFDDIKKYGLPTGWLNWIVNWIKLRYNNKLNFQLKRNFHFSNGQSKETPFSRMYEFEFVKDNQLLIKIKHNKFFNELAQNKLATKFYNITSYIYFHRCTNSKESYGFSRPNIYFNQNELQLKNQANRSFENLLYAPDIGSVTRTVNSSFKPRLLGAINTYDKNNFDSGVKTESILFIPF